MLELLQNALIYGGSFLLVLGVVVFVHEFGHFQVGRWCGIAIKSFSIGMGSEWFGWTDKHGTRWKVSKIPIGGFVSWVDDTDATSVLPATEESQELSPEEARRLGHFRAMPVERRAAAVIAGPMANFVFAIFAFALVAFAMGRDVTDYGAVTARVGNVMTGSAAAEAGLQRGEIVRAVNGEQVANWPAFQGIIAANPNVPLQLTLESEAGTRTLDVTPRAIERPNASGETETVGAIGVQVGVRPEERTIEPVGILDALRFGVLNTWGLIAQTVEYIGGIFSGAASGADIAGPVGILSQSGQVTSYALDTSDQGLWGATSGVLLALLGWAAVLSVAVGFANLLPIPILDGGYLVMCAVEALRGGKPLPPVAQEWAFRAGFAVLASLFLFATWNDITRLLPGGAG
ncbi:membrane-associated zinc metalloprotease [alpha proteobacterium U9-1i]|nr:membrane-associated zinc metalloprotease [alpha proteobacterium U9-1i]